MSQDQGIKKKLIEQLPEILNDEEIELLLTKLQSKQSKDMNLEAWRKELKEAKERGFFSVSCIKSAKSWGTCAVGSRLQVDNPQLARYFSELFMIEGDVDTPATFLTDDARKLGNNFYDAVKTNDVELAEKYFNEIQNLSVVTKKDEEKLNEDIKAKYQDSEDTLKPKKKHWWSK